MKQCLKYFLVCSDVSQEIPDDELVAGIFSEASEHSEVCKPPSWLLSGPVNFSKQSSVSPNRVLGVHMCTTSLMVENKTNDLVFLEGKGDSGFTFLYFFFIFELKLLKPTIIMLHKNHSPHQPSHTLKTPLYHVCSAGSTLEETRLLSAGYQNIVPVTSSGGHLALLDLSAPFLFRGRRRYYGSEKTSDL